MTTAPTPLPAAAPSPCRAGGWRRVCVTVVAAVLGVLLAGPLAAATARVEAPPDAPASAQPARAPIVTGQWVHGLSAYVPPKYPPGFAHFDYVNPDAPKGGTMRLRNPDRRSSFDKFNPFTVKGNAPAGVSIYMFESLAAGSQDELQAMYGLLAEAMYVEPDLSAIAFRLRPQARFSNGDAVTAADVAHSFEQITSKFAAPGFRATYQGIARAVAVDARTVRFELRDKKLDNVFLAGGVPVFSKKWGEGKPFDQIVLEHPIASGPYTIDQVDMPRRIEFKRDPDYWGRDLGVRRGMFNFDRVIYRMYADQEVAREAFKAGEFDIFKEYRSRAWARQHQGAKWRDGRIVRTAFETDVGQGLQAMHFNSRRPLFADARVREALTYTWDFENLDKYKVFRRASSVFNNSEFAAQGEPSAGELRLLEPFRAELPPRVFGPAYVAPSTANDPNGLRRNLLKARALLEQAGWTLAADGKLRNAKGEPFEFEYLNPGEGARNTAWERNLEKLGITYKERNVDFALYRRRLENYDFDIVTIVEGDFTLPSAADLITSYGSAAADEKGNNNFRGIKSRALDAMIEAMGRATTLDELRDAARAFDRVAMWNFWQLPELYLSAEWASYWSRFGMPATRPKYFTIDTGGFGPWPLMTWWDRALGAGGATAAGAK
jgi:peptide/nickel transport system substrate-binding protein/microcin C transport system substrate-binding protein